MKTKIITLLFIAFCANSYLFAQDKNEKNEVVIEVNANTKTIYLLGGIASAITKEDLEFAKKYNVFFHDFGCLPPANLSEYEQHNKNVFTFLKNQYGMQWQTEIKQGILGFEKWKKENL